MYRIFREIRRLGRVAPKAPTCPARAPCRSAAVRHVDSGSCNGCELEIQALNGPHYGLEQAGIHVTASPRHADILLVTGPVSRHMAAALADTYAATPAPKRVVAMGDCACTGGIFAGSYATCGGVGAVIPVDVMVAGCRPAPPALLHALIEAADLLAGDLRGT